MLTGLVVLAASGGGENALLRAITVLVNACPCVLWMAMGSGTQMAVESAGVTLLRVDLSLVPVAIGIAKRTVTTVKQNLPWTFLYNVIGLVLAVTGLLNPLIAAGAMAVSSLSVVLNSMRLRERKGRALADD